ncbi:MAG: YigZ family protein [Tissierellia bacterium]|nr:YigZ family protein [Tissierellia bacterium]
MYKTVKGYGEDSFIVKKSEFIGYTQFIETEAQALDFIDKIKSKNHDATHNCYAYIIGEKAMVQRFSDDGEPSGTAGIPILEVMKRENIVNCVIVVTRYFGGIMLGAGGLIRAYSNGAVIAINNAKRVMMKEHYNIKFKYDYTHHGKIENILMNLGYKINNMEFLDQVLMDIVIPQDEYEAFEKEMQNILSGEFNIITKNMIMEGVEIEAKD